MLDRDELIHLIDRSMDDGAETIADDILERMQRRDLIAVNRGILSAVIQDQATVDRIDGRATRPLMLRLAASARINPTPIAEAV